MMRLRLVPAFPGEVIAHIAGHVFGKRHPLGYQPVNGGFAVLDNIAGGGFIAQAGAGRQGVLDVCIQ